MDTEVLGFRDFDWTLSLAHCGAYLSIDDIIATSARLPCRLRGVVPRLAPLLISSHKTDRRLLDSKNTQDNDDALRDTDVPAGTKCEIPLWLALSLGGNRRHLLSIEFPMIYRESYREVFAADPWVIDLRKKGSHFFSVGCHLTGISNPEVFSVITTVENAFQRRIKSLMEAALNADKQDFLCLTSRLDTLEMALFRIGQCERTNLERWCARHHELLEASRVARDTLELIANESVVSAKQARTIDD